MVTFEDTSDDGVRFGGQLTRGHLDFRVFEEQFVDAFAAEDGRVGEVPFLGAESPEKEEVAGGYHHLLDGVLVEGQEEVGQLNLRHFGAVGAGGADGADLVRERRAELWTRSGCA